MCSGYANRRISLYREQLIAKNYREKIQQGYNRMTRNTYTQLLELFHSGKELSYDQAKEELRLLSVRQVQRIIARMKADGIPVRERRDGRKLFFYIDEENREEGIRIVLAEEHLLALAVAAEAARPMLTLTPLGTSLQKALRHLFSYFPIDIAPVETDDLFSQRGLRSSLATGLSPAVFIAIVHATAQCNSLYIIYSESGSRQWTFRYQIDPYGIVVRNGLWAVVAFCHEKASVQEFAITSIAHVESAEASFNRPDDFDLSTHINSQLRSTGTRTFHHVRLLVENRWASLFYRKAFHPSQYIEEQRDDGRLVVVYKVESLQEISAFVQSWGTDITVLGPEELRTLILQELSESLIRYGLLRQNQ